MYYYNKCLYKPLKQPSIVPKATHGNRVSLWDPPPPLSQTRQDKWTLRMRVWIQAFLFPLFLFPLVSFIYFLPLWTTTWPLPISNQTWLNLDILSALSLMWPVTTTKSGGREARDRSGWIEARLVTLLLATAVFASEVLFFQSFSVSLPLFVHVFR